MSWANSQSFSLLAGCTRLLRPKVFYKLPGVTSQLSCSTTICSMFRAFSSFTFTHFPACRCLMLSFICYKFPLCAHFKYAFNIQMFNLFARCFIGPHFTSMMIVWQTPLNAQSPAAKIKHHLSAAYHRTRSGDRCLFLFSSTTFLCNLKSTCTDNLWLLVDTDMTSF